MTSFLMGKAHCAVQPHGVEGKEGKQGQGRI
jgi:hypothetical protein